jgi:hypothetical protein
MKGRKERKKERMDERKGNVLLIGNIISVESCIAQRNTCRSIGKLKR